MHPQQLLSPPCTSVWANLTYTLPASTRPGRLLPLKGHWDTSLLPKWPVLAVTILPLMLHLSNETLDSRPQVHCDEMSRSLNSNETMSPIFHLRKGERLEFPSALCNEETWRVSSTSRLFPTTPLLIPFSLLNPSQPCPLLLQEKLCSPKAPPVIFIICSHNT